MTSASRTIVSTANTWAGPWTSVNPSNFSSSPLVENPPKKLLRWREEFMATRVESIITRATLALAEQHRAMGDELVIITASNSFVARPIAERFGAPTLLAVELERAGDR